MKIQSLAVIFIIIILPISILLETYVQSRVETLSLQVEYDSKLVNSTYDAIKAYQLNSFNSGTGDFVNSKMRDIKASVNTFFNSLSTNFSSLGYTKETIQNYVPAVVYTMYDGYYIYSPYTNTWDEETQNTHQDDKSFKNGESIYGLKPYVYYSCRYVKGNIDVVITYSLDSYISIQGTIGDEPVSKYGYLLSDITKISDNEVKYKGVTITNEPILKEDVYVDGAIQSLKYVKLNGIKYYKGNDGKVFSIINGKKIDQNTISFPENDNSAVEYYLDALEMQKFMKEKGLDSLTVANAVDANGNSFQTLNNQKIFDFDNSEGIESLGSNFNTHRIDVIKYSVTKNLSVAISNFNNYSGVSTNFQMPELKDTDWDKITDNIGMITFLQGMNIGGKVYNGYTVITNTKNEDVVTEDSIYIKTSNKIIHRVTEKKLAEQSEDGALGVFDIDLERRIGQNAEDGTTIYYYPKQGILSYDSIVTQIGVGTEIADNFKKIYYTALGRERQSLYREKLEFSY